MKNRKIFINILALIFLLESVSFSNPGVQENKSTSAKRPETGLNSFIKKEKLPTLEPALAVARRDLFRAAGFPLATEATVSNLNNQDYSSEEKVKAAQPLLQTVNIAFLGMTISGKKKVALIELDGQSLSLSEGEELLPGLRLVRIEPEEILIKDNQDNSRKIRLKET